MVGAGAILQHEGKFALLAFTTSTFSVTAFDERVEGTGVKEWLATQGCSILVAGRSAFNWLLQHGVHPDSTPDHEVHTTVSVGAAADDV